MKFILPELETERLILKKGTGEDYQKVYEYDFTKLRNIGGEFEYVKNDPNVVKNFASFASEGDNLDFIVFLKETNEPIGNVIYDRYNENDKSLEISVNLHPNYWRKGYMSEAIIVSMRYVFDNLDINKIIYGYAEENYKSKGLCEKIGFEFNSKCVEHYTRINKDVTIINSAMTKERFNELYK